VGGQTDSQVSSQIHIGCKKKIQGYGLGSRGQYPVFHWLIGCYNNEWTSLKWHKLGLGDKTGKNLRARPKFSTCESVWPGLQKDEGGVGVEG